MRHSSSSKVFSSCSAKGDLVGTQCLDALTEYGSRFVERELAVEVSLLGVEYDLELLHIDLGQVIAHILHTGRGT